MSRTSLPVIAVPECTDCGACCFSLAGDYIRVFDVDRARMDARAVGMTTVHEGVRFMRFEAGRCAALALDPHTGRVGCSIYGMRPDACRWLERGSGECHSQIAAKSPARDAAFLAARTPH